MADFAGMQGLAQGAGIAQGLSSGVDAFFKTRSMLNEEAIKKQLANAQSIEAISKLNAGMTPNQTLGLLRQQGLLSPESQGQGMLPQPASSGATNPNVGAANQPAAAAGSPGSPLAPSAQALDDSKPQAPDFMNMTPWQSSMYQKQAEAEWQQKQPQAKATLANTVAEPTNKAMEYIKEPAMQMRSSDVAFKNIHKALDQGGEMTPSAVLRWLPQVLNPRNPKPGDIPEAFDMDPKARTEINNAISKKLTGDFSPETKAAIRKVINNAYDNQVRDYQTLTSQTAKSFNVSPQTLNVVDLSSGRGLLKRTAPEAPSPVGGLLLGGGKPPGSSANAGGQTKGLSASDFLKELKARGVKP